MTTRIVVGIDGSPQSRTALELATEQARLRDGVVHAIHAWTPTTYLGHPQNVGVVESREELEAAAQQVLDEAVADLADDVSVDAMLWEGSAAATLIEASKGADLIAVGSRGRGGFTGLLLGSTSHQVTTHAACPVLVVPSGFGAHHDVETTA